MEFPSTLNVCLGRNYIAVETGRFKTSYTADGSLGLFAFSFLLTYWHKFSVFLALSLSFFVLIAWRYCLLYMWKSIEH